MAHILCPCFFGCHKCKLERIISKLRPTVPDVPMESLHFRQWIKSLDLNCIPKVQVLKTWFPDDSDVGMDWELKEVKILALIPVQRIWGIPRFFLFFFLFIAMIWAALLYQALLATLFCSITCPKHRIQVALHWNLWNCEPRYLLLF